MTKHINWLLHPSRLPLGVWGRSHLKTRTREGRRLVCESDMGAPRYFMCGDDWYKGGGGRGPVEP
eukprot:scaffold42370_cov32-Phaeocystis_antarctica.AAC.1